MKDLEEVNLIDKTKESEFNSIKDEVKEIITETKTRKAGSGRRKNSEIENEKNLNLAFGSFLSTLADVAVLRLPNPIPLSDMEKTLLASSAQKLAEKYSDKIGIYGEETAFIFSIGMILAPRLNLFNKKIEVKKEEIKKDGSTQNYDNIRANGNGQVSFDKEANKAIENKSSADN